MTKIKVEEVISQGEYIKRLIDEQGVENPFIEQITFLTDESILKTTDFETKDNVTYTNNGKYLVVQREIEIDEDAILKNIIVKYDKPYSSSTLISHYTNVSISHLVNETPLEIEEIYYLDDAINTQLIWEYGEMVGV